MTRGLPARQEPEVCSAITLGRKQRRGKRPRCLAQRQRERESSRPLRHRRKAFVASAQLAQLHLELNESVNTLCGTFTSATLQVTPLGEADWTYFSFPPSSVDLFSFPNLHLYRQGRPETTEQQNHAQPISTTWYDNSTMKGVSTAAGRTMPPRHDDQGTHSNKEEPTFAWRVFTCFLCLFRGEHLS